MMHRKRRGSITTSPCLKYLKDRCLAHEHYLEYIRNNVPSIFTKESFDRTMYKRLRVTMNYVIDTDPDNPEKADMVDYLREQMRRTGKEMNIRSRGVKATVIFYFVLYSPRFLIEGYRIYRGAKVT